MKVEIKDLKKKLQSLKFATNKNDLQGYGSHIYVHDKMIYTFNGYIKVACPFEYDIEFAVSAFEFIQFISKAKTKVIEMDIDDDKNFNMKSGNLSITMPNSEKMIRNLIDLPLTPTEFKKIPEGFITGVKKCVLTYSSDEKINNPNIYINGDAIASTDSQRVSEYLFSGGFVDPFLIPGKIAKELIKYNVEYYSREEQIIHFSSADDVIFSVVLIDDNFPDYGKLLDLIDGNSVTFPEELKAMVESMKAISKEEINVSIANGLIKCYIDDGDNLIEDSCIMDSEIDLDFTINSGSLIGGLSISLDAEIDLKHNAMIFSVDEYLQIITIWGK